MNFNIILCVDKNFGIGKDNIIPWGIKEDMEYFRKITSTTTIPNYTNAVIMGRNTFKSTGILKNRLNVVITSQNIESKEVITHNSLSSALVYLNSLQNIENIFVIGGAQLYNEAMYHPCLKYIYINQIINEDYKCDVKVKLNLENTKLLTHYMLNLPDKTLNKNVNVVFSKYEALSKGEVLYLELMQEILTKGDYRQTRNAKTYSMFGKQLKFNLDTFPLITTKKVPLRLIFEELMFFLRGQTDIKILQDKNIHIWDANTTQEFIDKMGLPYKENDMGPMYGHQFRHFGCEYIDKNTDYKDKGFDQLSYIINEMKTNPTSRRLLMTSFNPVDAQKSVLYPCHSLIIQFYVEHNKVSCHMYQRSQDYPVAAHFNIASTALLVYILCHFINNSEDYKGPYLVPNELVISYGDVHIYEEHVEAAKEQLKRVPYMPPKLVIKNKVKNITDYKWEDIELLNYKSHDNIKVKMVA